MGSEWDRDISQHYVVPPPSYPEEDGVADVVVLSRYREDSHLARLSGAEEPLLQAYSGKSGRRLWRINRDRENDVPQSHAFFFADPDDGGRVKLAFVNNDESRLLDVRTGSIRRKKAKLSNPCPTAHDGNDRLKGWRWGDQPDPRNNWVVYYFPWNASEGPPVRLCSPSGMDVTYCRRALPATDPAVPDAFDFSGIDPRLSVPLPWADRGPRRWLAALGAALAYLALVVGFALARRRWVVLGLLSWVLALPAVTLPWALSGEHALLAEERRDWTGWYWYWPDQLSSWTDLGVFVNPLLGAGVGLVLWAAFRYWRAARTGA
jgi:hypothetical protein